MNEEFARIKEQVEFQRKSIDALLSITKPEPDFPTIERICQKAIEPIREVTDYPTVTIRGYYPEQKCFKLLANGGMEPEVIKRIDCVAEDSAHFSDIMAKKEPVVIVPPKFIRDFGYEVTVFVPLIAGDIIVGSFELSKKHEYAPSEDEIRWLALVGRMLGSMIYQVQLTERMQNMGVIQERTRLAQELHDDVAQLVRSMRWGLEEARTSLENEQLDQTAETLIKLELMAQNTAAYLREEMLNLRERVDTDLGIIPILEGMLMRFERNWGIETRLVTECEESLDQNISLPSKTEIQLIRIVQEALMNIRRHANARKVTVKACKEVNRLVFEIIDDGIGFRLEDIPPERLGLRVMHERASSIGAKVGIETEGGTGTTLTIELPSYVGVTP